MNWFKKAKIDDFEDRNRVNHALHWLKDTMATLDYLSELVFMTNRGAKKMAFQLLNSKKMSSYPTIIDILEKAYEIALDSPFKFAILCRQASGRLKEIESDLLEQRDIFTNQKSQKFMKGLQDE